MSIPLLGEVTLPIRFGNFESSFTGLVSEHISEVMLGIDWLTENQIVWEFGQSLIRVANENYHLNVHSGHAEWCRRVTLQHDITVPARSEIDLPIKVICRPWKESPTDLEWSSENAIISGVYVSRTLLPKDRLSDVPVRVINVQSEPVHLTAGTVIANV